MTYGINLPTTPQTGTYSSAVANSELTQSCRLHGRIRLWPAPERWSATTYSTFVNESVDGGTVTLYDSTGTPANLEMRWAKTDSVANGGTDTWQLFYQVDGTATGAAVGMAKCGHRFTFNSSGQLNPSSHESGV